MSICCLFNKSNITKDDLQELKTIKAYRESSHLDHILKQCPHCGGYIYYEFYEYVDWNGGNDQMYCTYIPVDDILSGDALYEKCKINGHSYLRTLAPSIYWNPDGSIQKH